jgi:hypothetical protein
MDNKYLLISGLCGLMIPLCFVYLSLFLILKSKSDKSKLKKTTLTELSLDKNRLKIAKYCCYIVSFLVIPYLIGIKHLLVLNNIIIILSILAFLAIFLTGYTLDKPKLFHQISVASFFIVMVLIQYTIISNLGNRWLYLNFIIILLVGFVIIFKHLLKEYNISAYEEIIFMGLNSIWVIYFSILIIIN